MRRKVSAPACLAAVLLALTGTVAVPVVASAQFAPTPNGITVVGRATVSVPPDRLDVVVRLNPRNVSAQRLEALADSLAAAMRTGGIGDAHPVLPVLGNLGPGSTIAVVGTVERPTRPSLETTLRAVLKALPDDTAAALENAYGIQTSYRVSDCAAVEARAQVAAVADARARAERAAAAAGVHVGPILSLAEPQTFPPSACAVDPDVQNGPGQGFLDPYGPVSVPVSVTVTVVFALR